MTLFRFAFVGCLALFLASCKESVPNGKNQAGPVTEDTGHLGETSGGNADARFVIKSPYWRTGDQVIVCGLAEYPGKALQPAFVLLLKLPSKTNVGASSSVGGDGEKSYWHPEFRTSGEKTYPIKYEIKHKPVGEQLVLGEKTHSLESGHVFLVDLAAQPVQVIQVKADVKDLVAGGDPGRDRLKGAVDKLRADHEKVRTFWQEPKQP